MKQVEEEKLVQQRKEARAKTELSQLSSVLGETSVTSRQKWESRIGYSGRSPRAISPKPSGKLGHPIDKRHVELEEPIRHLGTYKVAIRVGPRAMPSVTVVVEAKSAS